MCKWVRTLIALRFKSYASCVVNASKIMGTQDELHSSDWGVCSIYREDSMYLARGRVGVN